MDKWTVIIPTLWKSKYIHEQLKEYIWCRNISEIIIIDNSNQYFEHHSKIYNKVNLIQPEENLYVNPSWNLGVEESKTENIIIANDDIIWNTDYLTQINDNIFNRFDVIGQVPQNYQIGQELSQIKDKGTQDINITENNKKRPTAWGCLLFTKKSRWIPIPNELKIWYGDDWMIHLLKTGKIENFTIGGELSASETNEFGAVRVEDRKVFKRVKDEYLKNKNE